MDIQVGSTIMNGSSALRVDQRVEKDPRWNGPGWSGINIPLEAFGGNPGTRGFLPDYLALSWRHVPFEWTVCPGGKVEERYVWSRGYRYLQREVRRIVELPAEDASPVGLTEAGACVVDNATGWCSTHERTEA